MSTHNIGFYEEISKIITYLSSNIIKYAPYFFCWILIKSKNTSVILQLIHVLFFRASFVEDEKTFWVKERSRALFDKKNKTRPPEPPRQYVSCSPEPRHHGHEKTCFLYFKTKAKISCVVTSQLVSAFFFATRIVQTLYFLNLKFHTCSHHPWLYSQVCVGPSQKPRR